MAYGWLASVESNSVSEIPYPEPGISQETRASMYPETYSDKMGKVLNKLVEEMFAPVLPIDRLNNQDILLLAVGLRGFALLRLLRGLLIGCVVILLCVLVCYCIARSRAANFLGRDRHHSLVR